MYILSYTTEDKHHSIIDWNDHYELFATLDDAKLAASKITEEEGVTMWAISKVILASEPHWMEG